MEVPIWIIEMEHGVIFDIIWDVWVGLYATEVGDVR